MAPTLQGFVPYVHVRDVRVSQSFYEMLEMICDSRFGSEGDPYWARMKGVNSDLMLAKASGPIDASQQAVLFYLYSTDISDLCQRLLAAGLSDGGVYSGVPMDADRKGVVFQPYERDYMPGGEMRIHDPDGYVLLVGQMEP